MSRPSAAEVIARRRAWQAEWLDIARDFSARLDPTLGVRAVVVFGSLARGDFHQDSDIDLLVVAEHLPERYQERLAMIGWPAGDRVEAVAWTPAEYRAQRRAHNLIAVEAEACGVWLVGAPEALAEP